MFSGSAAKEKGAEFELKELAKDYEVGFDSLMAVLAYLYSGKVKPLPKDVCVCVDEDCSHVACRPAVDFMVEVLYASFTFQVPELVALYQVRVRFNLNFTWKICFLLLFMELLYSFNSLELVVSRFWILISESIPSL